MIHGTPFCGSLVQRFHNFYSRSSSFLCTMASIVNSKYRSQLHYSQVQIQSLTNGYGKRRNKARKSKKGRSFEKHARHLGVAVGRRESEEQGSVIYMKS